MSLRLRLFLGLACLVTLMVTAQWWWVRGLTSELSEEVGTVVLDVGHSMVALLASDFDSKTDPSPPPGSVFAFRHRSENNEETHEAWVGVHEDGEPPSWVKVPEGAEDVHWVGGEGGESTTRKFKVKRSAVGAGGMPHQIMLSLDMDLDKQTDGSANFFFSDTDADKARYLTVLADAAGDSSFTRRIPIPSQGLADKLETFRRRMLWGSLAIFGVGLLFSALVAQRVSAPLRRLSEAAREVGEGSLGKQIQASASGEVGQAIHAFNRMSSELESYDRKTRDLQAREHLGEIGEIARGLAHTLRNPLNALGLSVEELAAQAQGDTGGLASSARRQIRRIDHSIRSFLALASQGGGVISQVEPGELVQDVALEALQDARGRVKLDVQVEGEPPLLRAVEPELRAVLQALVVNAVEASPEGGTVSVRVRPEKDQRRVHIAIEDQGPGLPEEVRGRLFTPHLTTKANGSGMGLFLAHRIATTRYDGRLELENLPGAGARAVLEIGPRGQEQRPHQEPDHG